MLGIRKGMWLSQSGEWKSDDSNDSDFEISDEEKPKKSKRPKIEKKTRPRRRKGPIRNNINWSDATQLTHLDIYYSEQTNTYATAEIELTKLQLPNLRFLQLANVVLNERGLARLLEKVDSGETQLLGFPNLTFLSLRRSFLTANNSVDSLLFLLRNTENLRTLDLQGCYRYDYEDLLTALGKALKVSF